MSKVDKEALDYSDLCAVGRARADMMVLQMREDGNPLLLTSAVKEVGQLTPIQIGFFTRVACLLITQ
ncbi:hypothetical protein [Sphingomonas phyllosphaerae]|uniref:hypothetical protein n=1 Tax=Sphingomonas phyllosphaerae TaxID=257003 RepID=UPI0012DF96D9|nr:hypothetical protein [Sphingomonas phyllosphaerae]